MKTGKKILSLILTVIMCLSIVPVADLGFEASAGLTLTELKQKFPHGKYWNHANNPGSSNSVNNQNGYTSTPCTLHGGYIGTSSQTCNGFAPSGTQLSWQCMGYAEKLGYDATGYNPRNNANGWQTSTSSSALNNLKPGDIVRYKNNGHSIYVTAVNGDTVTYTDCNSDGHCKIRWGETISKSTLKSTFTHVRSAPQAVSIGSSGSSHTRNTSYGTNFSATAKEKIDVFNADHSDPGNYYIDAGDKCTIHEVYTDGCCKVTYPSSASSTGTRTYYAPFNKFSVATNYADPVIELVYWGDNGTTTHFRPVVQIKNPETVDHISFPTWSHNGDGAQHNLVWYDTVFNGGLCWFNDLAYDKFSYQFIECHCYVYGKNGSVQNVALPRNYNRNFTYELDVNMVIDGVRYNSGASGFTFDYYIDGNLVGDDISDWCEKHYCGQTYEIKDVKTRTGYVLQSGNLSGVITSNSEALLTFVQGAGVLDLNGILDGGESGAIGGYGTADIYINGSLVSSGCWDYCETLPAGTKYEIKNIKAATGKQYNGVYSGSLSGTITNGITTKVFLNFSRIGYSLYFDVNHDNIKPNLYKPTKSTKTINGVTYQYNASKDTIKLNGSLTASDGVIDSYNFKPVANSYYKVTAKVLSGSFSNSILVIEAKTASAGTVGSRIFFDIYGTSSKTWYFSSADANSTTNIQTWLYCSNANTAKINNAEIQIKIEKVASSTSSGTEFSPSMKGMHYNEAYPTTVTPTRSGYTFDGWYTTATGGTKITSSSRYPAANQTLYAHWTCNHSTTEVRNAKSATCNAEGYTGDTYCKTCGTKTKTGTAIAKLTHSYTSAITTQPTCTKAGVKTFTCTCGASYTEAIAKVAHQYRKLITQPTCTEKGFTTYLCSVCGYKYTDNLIAPNGHRYIATVTTQPTCTKDGIKTYKCTCGASYTEAIAKKAHTEIIDKAVTATCTKTGLTEGKHCSVCSTVIVPQQTISTVDHTDANSDYKCDYGCGYEFEKPVAPTPDTPTEPDDNKDDDSVKNCSHMCHKGGFMGLIWKIIRIFLKLFRANKICGCGIAHY